VSEKSKAMSKTAAAAPPVRPRAGSNRTRPAAGRATAKPRPRGRFRRDFILSAVLGGIAFGLVLAFAYGLYMPKAPWAFDRPEAQLPSLQPRHTLQ
jgi:hypothetical protein